MVLTIYPDGFAQRQKRTKLIEGRRCRKRNSAEGGNIGGIAASLSQRNGKTAMRCFERVPHRIRKDALWKIVIHMTVLAPNVERLIRSS